MTRKNRRKFILFLTALVIVAVRIDAVAQSLDGDSSKFIDSVKKRLSIGNGAEVRGPKFEDVCRIDADYVSKTVFTTYGAAFLVTSEARPPSACVYTNEAEVSKYQNATKYTSTVIDGAAIELQEAAMTALLSAIKQAKEEGLSITPLDGSVAARRSYSDTVRIWNSRVYPNLAYWVSKGRIRSEDAEAAKRMDIDSQIVKVLEWESKGIFFSTNRSKSILYATAPPGTSQHISMLAFDVVENDNRHVQEIMAANGWFQTIVTDTPHFTYLGRKEDELAGLGLKRVRRNGHTFWVPPL